MSLKRIKIPIIFKCRTVFVIFQLPHPQTPLPREKPVSLLYFSFVLKEQSACQYSTFMCITSERVFVQIPQPKPKTLWEEFAKLKVRASINVSRLS